ncbi:MAG TPA: hypothetical protein VGK50_03050 [Coriobacteriia bacterium]|jgi:hypothetical protein
MEKRPLAPCLVGNGTVTLPRDMIRALETLETVGFVQEVDGEVMAEGRATLVKLMADQDSATILVNGCLFLNVTSFRYLMFTTAEDGECVFTLVADGMKLTMTPFGEPDIRSIEPQAMRLLEETAFDPDAFVTLEEDDEDE